MNDSLDSLEGIPHQIIRNDDGSVKTHIVKINGSTSGFRCEVCGSNCFHQYDDEPDKYYCNSCNTGYLGK